eukprot:TRINITY_DN3244_c0_g2_i4.p2 TRINITY_DN3244_c0_g2~~TRINITY_DN3244_c0_g2_i4.p2  ORF type:complete len:107 (+),score=8.73 TRINITY_DN3244_c0_g2_i4:63-383(+)
MIGRTRTTVTTTTMKGGSKMIEKALKKQTEDPSQLNQGEERKAAHPQRKNLKSMCPDRGLALDQGAGVEAPEEPKSIKKEDDNLSQRIPEFRRIQPMFREIFYFAL